MEGVSETCLTLYEGNGISTHGLALVGNGLGKQGLSGSWRPVEEDTLGRRHAVLEELLGVLDRVLDSLLELLLHFLETTDVLPFDVGDLDNGLSESRWVGDTEGKSEILHGDSKRVKNLGVDSIPMERKGNVHVRRLVG